MSVPDSRLVVLVVDDELSVMRTVTSTLAGAGYDVLTAQDGKSGLDLFDSHADKICLVLADIAMPVMGGICMAEAILERRPDTRILLMTGYNDTVVGSGTLKLPLLRKPFLPVDLVRKVKAVLEGAHRPRP